MIHALNMSVSAVLDLAAREWLKKAAPILIPIRSRLGFKRSPASALVRSKAEILIVRRTLVVRSVSGCGDDMAANALIDSGAILALLDRTDRWHSLCVEGFRQLRLPLLTSEAVVTELFHLVGDSRHEMEAAWKFLRSGAVIMAVIED